MKRDVRPVQIGPLTLGKDRIVLQTMWKEPLTAAGPEIAGRLAALKEKGCEMLRFSVPDEASVARLSEIAPEAPFPLVADIHFDYRLALGCIRAGIDKIRINPGNIGNRDRLRQVLQAAGEAGTAIRIGINGGSLPSDLRKADDTAAAMLEAAEREMAMLENEGFGNALFSLKSSDWRETVRANRLFRERYDYPLHLGVTEAGPLLPGVIKSTLALGELLQDGIGETIRISLTASPEDELRAGRELLKALDLRRDGAVIISCPRCGRSTFDTHRFMGEIEATLEAVTESITVAVMGCVVNGPGEASHADIGITGSGNQILIFRRGRVVRKVSSREALPVFREELARCLEEMSL